ncbi:neuromedin-U isoform X2 [Manis pentadactyla]|uniref:neuromedin-U isoform X2 n=1 Tax=Manis pentadactyla TaxID=143292 RepID=UPI00255D0A49|nr:neuromedin-U isoform X2 [Manis pentadactyla]
MLVHLSCPWILSLSTKRMNFTHLNTRINQAFIGFGDCVPFEESLASNALEELCIAITGTLPKPQETDEKDNAKRFLFHYSKTQKLGNSNVVSSVVHPLLQLVPQLHERRMKRFKVDGEFQGPFASESRRYFLFRPRNGRRSEGYI